MNAALAGKWTMLDQRWNWSPRLDRSAFNDADSASPEKSPWIVHFSGNLKPWHFEGRSAPYELYYRYLDSTAWAGWRPARSWKHMVLSHYESSRFRNTLAPLENLAMSIERAMTLRYVTADGNAAAHLEGATSGR